MALTTDNILSILALVVMCIPGLWLLFKFVRHSYVVRRGVLLPTANPEPRSTYTWHREHPAAPHSSRSLIVNYSDPAQANNAAFEFSDIPSRYRMDERQMTVSWSTRTYELERAG
ncbi:uncharacterized protein F4822DRAFT_389702 [Hypoxylon trugodes]|uniref:uncharacterized protein n=1 Tax=Hypoxylon trugodes TaxID=326681 RepID=UPI002190467A|nr:uncharacterized protein F4822DRAFT_389702 [Hypoxylon trugodes]KAI1392138.1 hypothetical protein F4822DRAFT_389702 [Hypoxylon trugodes]